MIKLEKTLQEVQLLMANTTLRIESLPDAEVQLIKSGVAFENKVFNLLLKENEERKGSYPKIVNIYQTGKLAFPDIVIEMTNGLKFGIEIKYSDGGKWNSLGNSIFESTSIPNLSEVFLLFGSRRELNKIEVKYMNYQEAVSGVKVTHSPRFVIDMVKSNKFFEDLKIDYSEFKEEDKHKKGSLIKNYFRSGLKEGEEVWWLDADVTETDVKLKSYSSLTTKEQRSLLLEALILFPEVLSDNNRSKYSRVSVWWLTKYQVYNSALRDVFSASGVKTITLKDSGEVTVSKIYYKLNKYSACLSQIFDDPSPELINNCKESWAKLGCDTSDLVTENLATTWLQLIDNIGVKPADDLLPSEVYNGGLN